MRSECRITSCSATSKPRRSKPITNKNQDQYEVGYKKPPLGSRYQKGKSGNPSGKRKEVAADLDPGKVLQTIDNEEIIVTIDGKRKRMRKGEVHCRQLFTKAIKGNLTAAKLIAKTAAKYFGVEEANGPSETTFLVVSNKMFEPKTEGGANACVRETRKAGSKKRPSARPKVIGTRQQVPIGLQFRKVAGESITIEIDGTPYRISRWNAYVRQIYNMALNKNNSAARLLDQLRSQFPGDLLPGDPITFIISEDDARL